MKSTWFSDRKRYDFAKCLQEADYSQHSWELMRIFLQATVAAFRQASRRAAGLDFDPSLESIVIECQARCRHPERLSHCLGILVQALEANADDFLGSTISELGQNDAKWKGQCFTPTAVCRMMAEMTVGEYQVDPHHRLTLSEPACGGGAMVIATSEVLQRNGFFPWNYYWTCVDVDWRMFAITYIQLTLLGIPAGVIHGNTLSVEQHDSASTLAAVLHPHFPQDRKTEQQPEAIDSQVPAIQVQEPVEPLPPTTTVTPAKAGQLHLFN